MWGIELQTNVEPGFAVQIFRSLKEQILTGRIPQGEALPSTRELAQGLGVSRNTVNSAYDMLWTEGYIIRSQGAPTRVAEGLSMQVRQQNQARRAKISEKPPIHWDFRTGQPDLAAFGWKQWNDILRDAANSLAVQWYGYDRPKGYAPLCTEIADWLLRSRSMSVEPETIFITSGSTQALYLLADILHRDGSGFALENPSHPGIRNIITDRGYEPRWLPVDAQGADVSDLNCESLAAVYVTPSHQYPLGGILPATRRAALLRQAAEHEFYIIEDDYDSEFRYSGSPVSPIYTMDSSRVIYVGTFSKTVFPALRIGFAVLPEALHGAWNRSRNYLDVQNPVLEQAALAEFLKTRKMDRHVRTMRRLYGEKRGALLHAIHSAFGDSGIPWGDASGLHLALQFPGKEFNSDFFNRCKKAGLYVSGVSRYCASPNEHTDKLLIGYGNLTAEQIREGIQVLGKLL